MTDAFLRVIFDDKEGSININYIINNVFLTFLLMEPIPILYLSCSFLLATNPSY